MAKITNASVADSIKQKWYILGNWIIHIIYWSVIVPQGCAHSVAKTYLSLLNFLYNNFLKAPEQSANTICWYKNVFFSHY